MFGANYDLNSGTQNSIAMASLFELMLIRLEIELSKTQDALFKVLDGSVEMSEEDIIILQKKQGELIDKRKLIKNHIDKNIDLIGKKFLF